MPNLFRRMFLFCALIFSGCAIQAMTINQLLSPGIQGRSAAMMTINLIGISSASIGSMTVIFYSDNCQTYLDYSVLNGDFPLNSPTNSVSFNSSSLYQVIKSKLKDQGLTPAIVKCITLAFCNGNSSVCANSQQACPQFDETCDDATQMCTTATHQSVTYQMGVGCTPPG
jgi:ABC-type Fe3+-siderophore transport system permease subunit